MQSTQRPPEGYRSILRHIMRRLIDQIDPQPTVICPPGRPVITFVPGHIGVVAVYPSKLDIDEKDVIGRIRSALSQIQIREDINWTTERVTILRGRDQTLAAVFGDVPGARNEPARLLSLITQINNETLPPPQTTDPGSPNPKDPQPGLYRQEYRRATSASGGTTEPTTPPPAGGLKPDDQGFQVIAASPNWLGGGATQNSVGGGPGATPVAVPAPPINPPPAVRPWDWTLPLSLRGDPNTDQDAVEVAILDTAPSEIDLRGAHDDLIQNAAEPHELLAQLLGDKDNFNIGDTGRLHVIYADTNMMGRIDASLFANAYHMPDHGLFVSGIINSIAPNAKLHLIEVLNAYGVGSLETLTEGFAQVVAIRTTMGFDKPLVVNCSLILNIPQSATQLTQQQLLAGDIEGLTEQEAFQMAQMLGFICQLVSPPPGQTNGTKTILVAAAGNDSSPNLREPARFPAAYTNVTGVGALRRNFDPTPYSNTADAVSIGYVAFGGETVTSSTPPSPVADAVDGVLGVFVGAIGGVTNASGWARWAGTSFSTAVLSGLFARLIGPTNPTLDAANIAIAASDSDSNIGDIVHMEQG
jgi:hypothetical protein